MDRESQEGGVSLREYLETKIDGIMHLVEGKIAAIERATELAFENSNKAAEKADAVFETRMNTTNEWRGALQDQANSLATKQQVEQFEKQLIELKEKVEAKENKALGVGQLIGIVVVIISAVSAILAAVKVFA